MSQVKGTISIKDNMTAVLRGVKKEQQSLRKDVQETKKALDSTFNKKHTAKVETSSASKAMDSLKKKMDPLKKKIQTVIAVKDSATSALKGIGNKIKSVGKMAAKPIIAIKDATAAGLSKIKSRLKAIAKTVAIPVTIAGAAVLGGAIKEGAKLEQSIGGVETLFKDDSGIVKANADKAFHTAGLSANEYMETVTSFSASLLNSLGGDTAKSASVADMAMIDMADNANKFGTDMDSIQNAYQGFAKQNYTMLDNLKLGYGGTKEEMSRLLGDATKLTGVKYDISNLSDVYTAINAIQNNLGVTGTTAKEASATFSGSFASMKAAASNLLGNLAIGGDVTGSVEQLVESASTFLFENAVPMIGKVISALPGAIKTAIAKAGPKIKESGGAIVKNLKDGIINILPSSMGNLITPLFDAFGNIGSVFTGFSQTAAIVRPALDNILAGFVPLIPVIMEFGGSIMQSMGNVATAVIPVITSVVQTIQELMPTILPVISSVIGTVSNIITAAAPVIQGLVQGIGTVVQALAPIFQTIFDGIGEKVGSVLSFVGEQMGWINEVISTVMPVIQSVLTTAWGVISPVLDIVINVFKILFNVTKTVFNGISNVISSVWGAIQPIISAIGDFFNWIGGALSSVGDFLFGGGGGGGSIGSNAEGTNNWRGGLTWVGEDGPELIDLPHGTRILPNKESLRYAKGVENASAGKSSALGGNVAAAVAPIIRNTTVVQQGSAVLGGIKNLFSGIKHIFTDKPEDDSKPEPTPVISFPPPGGTPPQFPQFPSPAPTNTPKPNVIIEKICETIEIHNDDDYNVVGKKMVAALKMAAANS